MTLKIDKIKFQYLWDEGYTGPQLEEYFKCSSYGIKKIKKELGITGKPILKIDKDIILAETMWKSNKYTKVDMQNKFSCQYDTIHIRAKTYNWGKFIPLNYGIFDGTQKSLKDILVYNRDTGLFIWKNTMGSNAKKGKVAGSLHHSGYLTIKINNKNYQAHRLAVLYVLGEFLEESEVVDHIDHDRSNNSWNNLRVITQKENCKNASLSKNNTSGQIGVSYDNTYKKWQVRIKDNSNKYLHKYFINRDKAVLYAKEKYKELGYHENHGKLPSNKYDNGQRRSDLIKQQTPENMDKDLMKLILDNTPEGYHDDHIVPLSKGGLHEPSNIQYITKEENLKKGNKLDYICETAINPIYYLIDEGILDKGVIVYES